MSICTRKDEADNVSWEGKKSKFNSNEIDLLHPKLPKFKPDDWKIVWICVLLFLLINTIAMSIGESRQLRRTMNDYIPNLEHMMENKLSQIETKLTNQLGGHYHKFLTKKIQHRK